MSKSKSIYFSLHKISTHYRIGRPDCIELPLSLQVLFEELKDEPLEQQLTDSVVEYYGEDHSSGVIIRTELIGSEEEFYYLELLTSGDIRKRPGSQTGPED